MSSRFLTLGVFVGLLLTAGIAAAVEGGSPDGEDVGMPHFLEDGAELPPGLAKKEVLPPGLAKKLDGNTPRGQAMKEGTWTPPGQAKKGDGWLPPGLAKKGKIPPGHAKRLGVEPTEGSDTEE